MIEWILVIFIFAGPQNTSDGAAILRVPDFQTEKDCREAGKASGGLVFNSGNVLRFVCLQRPKKK